MNMNRRFDWLGRCGGGSIPALFLLIIFAGSISWSPTVQAGDRDGASACQGTAKKMFSACRSDTRDDFFTTLANCQNIADADARADCRDDARADRAEALELCGDQKEARGDVCEALGENRFDPDPLLDPTIQFVSPASIGGSNAPNLYFSLVPGSTTVSRTGLEGEEIDVIFVTDVAREISGQECRIVADVAVEESFDEDSGEYEYIASEATDDSYVQDINGNVYYCGEVSRSFEDGILRELDGSFESGVDFAKGGLLIRAAPAPGDIDRQEFSLGDAEDIVEYLTLHGSPSEDQGGENPNDEFRCDGNCLATHEFAPLEPDIDGFKFYLPNVGIVLAVDIADGEVIEDREVTQCVGDSLEVLDEESCGIGDPEAMLEELCKLSPDAFCADD